MSSRKLRLGWVSRPDPSSVNKRTMNAKVKDAKGQATPITVGQVARWHELGRGKNPKRGMLKATLKRNRPEVRALYRRATAALMAGNITGEVAFGVIGEGVLSLIKARMRRGISPPLKQGTIDAKRRATASGASKDTPLIRWGILLSSVRYKIVTGRSQ